MYTGELETFITLSHMTVIVLEYSSPCFYEKGKNPVHLIFKSDNFPYFVISVDCGFRRFLECVEY